MEQFIVVLNQLFQFFIILFIGYYAAKKAIISKGFLDGLASLIMKILLPILIFANATNGTSRKELIACYPILFLSIGMYAGLMILFYFVAKFLKLKGDKGRVFQAAMIFGNAGFLGIPLLTAVFPARSALYITLMSIIDQGCLWTYGLSLTTPKSQKVKFHFKNFMNPALGAVLLAIIVLLCNIHIPNFLLAPFLTAGRSATPLSLLYLGGLLFYSNWIFVLKQKELYIGVLLKLICFPLIYYFVTMHLLANKEMIQTMTLISALPTMTSIAMFAQSKENHGDYALGLVLASTILSLITLCLISFLIL